MNETQLLNETLNSISGDDTSKAYEFLVSNLNNLETVSGQVYNFLYCLAATSNKPSEALDWMEEAIEAKGQWYRPELFEDDDLASIRDDERFVRMTKISAERFQAELDQVTTVFTWKDIKKKKLITVLHGNQQNNHISKSYWSTLEGGDYQVEYLQSKEIDSCDLFRWEDHGDGPLQLENALLAIEGQKYESTVLAGFSAGCNTILRALNETSVTCDKVILQSPWIPSIEENPDEIIKTCVDKNIDLLMICGLEDEDCLPQCKLLESKAEELGLQYTVIYIKGLVHEYPSNFDEIVRAFL